MNRLLSLITVFSFISSSQLLPSPPELHDEIDGRLPRDILPYHYNLKIHPYIDDGTIPPFNFDGEVEILFECFSDTNVVILNAQGLTINIASVKIGSLDLLPSPSFLYHTRSTKVDFEYFHLTGDMHAGRKYFIKLSFFGVLRTPGMDGLYYDSYNLTTNETKYIAATQFESINARNMFPCFDEVDMKATFNITVVRRQYHISLSNMPLHSITFRPDNWIEDLYYETPVMSTYIVCITVGVFQYVEARTEMGYKTPIRIYATPSQIQYLDYAANIVYKTQKWLENTTGIAYHTPKMDHIAYPSKGGAMENWGLITYGEESLTVNPQTSSIIGKQNVGAIISHELAHQWYGNLVTCKWWNDLWLNEGFATHYNYYPTEALGWNAEELQQIDSRRGTQPFLTSDARNTSDPIIKDIPSAQTSENAFSGSTYPKGGAVVRMISGLMTRSSMEKAFTRYLRTNSYNNAQTDQLYIALAEQARIDEITINGQHINFKEVLDPWLYQMGFPLLTIMRGPPGVGIARQSRFLNPAGQKEEVSGKFGYKWPIPITIVTSENTNEAWDATPDIILHPNQDEVEITIPVNTNHWYIINPKQKFIYRVLYDPVNRAALVNQLLSNHEKIEVQSRSQIIDDTFTLARFGAIEAIDAFETTQYIAKENIYNPWSSMLKHVTKIANFFASEQWFYLYENYVIKRLDPQLRQLGWTFNDSQNILEQYLRRDIISTSCSFGIKDCVDHAKEQYINYSQSPESNRVDPNVLPTVLCEGVRSGNSLTWNSIFQDYLRRKASQIREERHAYLFALSCTSNTALLDIYFEEIFFENNFNSKDLNQATQYLASTLHGSQLLFNYLDINWSSVPSSINRLTTINTITSTWHTQEQYNQLKGFIERRKNLSSSQFNSLTQSLLDVQQNVQFTNDNRVELHAWMLLHQTLPNEVIRNRPIEILRDNRELSVSAFNHWQLVADSFARDFAQYM